MKIPCPDCRKAPEHKNDPRHCAYCRGKADFPEFDPVDSEEEKHNEDGSES